MAEYKQPKKVANSDTVHGRLTVEDLKPTIGNVRGFPYPATKTDGVKIRGTGAATKGTKARGPMA